MENITQHWATGYGSKYNPNRSDALEKRTVVPDFDNVLLDIETRTGKLRIIIATSAKRSAKAVSFEELGPRLRVSDLPL